MAAEYQIWPLTGRISSRGAGEAGRAVQGFQETAWGESSARVCAHQRWAKADGLHVAVVSEWGLFWRVALCILTGLKLIRAGTVLEKKNT